MIKVKAVENKDNYILQIIFSNGEIKVLDFEGLINENSQNKYFKKIADKQIFNNVKVGLLGEIYWENIATIKELNGSTTVCNFDFSPEFIYAHSK